jgi:hypothetical protein
MKLAGMLAPASWLQMDSLSAAHADRAAAIAPTVIVSSRAFAEIVAELRAFAGPGEDVVALSEAVRTILDSDVELGGNDWCRSRDCARLRTGCDLDQGRTTPRRSLLTVTPARVRGCLETC